MLRHKEEDIEVLSGSFADGKGAKILVRIGNKTEYRTIRKGREEGYIMFDNIPYYESDFINAAWITEIDLTKTCKIIEGGQDDG